MCVIPLNLFLRDETWSNYVDENCLRFLFDMHTLPCNINNVSGNYQSYWQNTIVQQKDPTIF